MENRNTRLHESYSVDHINQPIEMFYVPAYTVSLGQIYETHAEVNFRLLCLPQVIYQHN